MGGRFQKSPIPEEARHQIILSSSHHVTKLIINHEHQKYAHFGGYRYVLARIRSCYWIISGPTSVKHYLKDCRICRQLKAKPLHQIMAPLPTDRLTAGRRLFHSTAYDCFGLLDVVVKRSVCKRLCCLFTFLASQTIHIEIVYTNPFSVFLTWLDFLSKH